MRQRRPARTRGAAAVLLLVVVAACGAPAPTPADPTSSPSSPSSPATASSLATASISPAPTTMAPTAAPGPPAPAPASGTVAPRERPRPTGAPGPLPTSVPPVAPGFRAPPVQPTGASAAPRTSRPAPPRSIVVSGPTLDNLYPQDWGIFESPGRVQCAYVPNGDEGREAAGVAVRVSVRVTGQQPAGPARFAVVTPAASDCLDRTDVHSVGACAGHAAPPGGSCTIAVRTAVPAGSSATARLLYSLEATCASKEPAVCAKVGAPAPTPAAPVTVRWGYQVDLVACFDPAKPDVVEVDGHRACG